MQNRSEPCIWDKYPCQSGTDRQKGGVFAYFCELSATRGQCAVDKQVRQKKENNLTI